MQKPIDLSVNPKQLQYYLTAIDAVNGLNNYRYFCYGGAIRGGKSFVTAIILLKLADQFPGSRWHVIRQDFPVLEATTIATFRKILGNSPNFKFVRSKSNYHILHQNGSQIFFKGENLARDPDLNDFLGLETNGIWLEQAEELSERTWQRALERTGSWNLPDMPPAFLFLTFNPTQNWVKQKFYEPHRQGILTEPYFFMSALPKDNPFVTADQWNQWDKMSEQHRRQFIEGDWTDFTDTNNLWAFAYHRAKHSGQPQLNANEVVYLSFDFNVNPMCCAVIQHYGGKIRVLELIKLPNSSTAQMCDYILSSPYSRCALIITGDATGVQRHASQVDSMHNYAIIQQRLGLPLSHFRVPGTNPLLQHNKVLVNAILQSYPVEIHTEKARALHYDLANVRTNPDNTIVKSTRSNPNQQSDALDTFRYWCNMFMGGYLQAV